MAKQQIFDRYMRDLEPEIQALARQAELGELRQVYHARKSDRPIWIFGLISLVYGGAGLALSILAYFASSFSISLLWTGPGVLLFALGLWLLRPEKIYRRWHIYLWEEGLIYEKGSERQAMRWNQIERIQSTPGNPFRPTNSTFNYQIHCKDGSEVTVKSFFRNGQELADALLKNFLSQASAGELRIVTPHNRSFGACTIDRDGIRSGQEGMLGWKEIEEVVIEKGNISALTRIQGEGK
ncbi:MAG TPA: DUF6585 family protein [Ktedonobacteraceae bacterium]